MAKKAKTFLDDVLEVFGEKVLDNHSKEVEVISTGSLSLDASIGVGGIPRGMFTELFGPEGSGKTSLALATCKTVVLAGGKALYIDVENLLNTEILKSALGNIDKIENIIILTPDSAEDAFIMAEKAIDSKEFDIIVIDSIGAMASRREKEVDFDKDTMGVMPRLISKFIKRNVYNVRTTNIAILLLNQVRDNVGSYVKSYSSPGGHNLKHQAAVRIALSKGEDLKYGNDIVGIMVKFIIKKNKLAPPFRSYTVPLIFGKGIDYITDLLEFSKLIGVVQQSGPYYKFEGNTLGQGKKQTIELLENSKETVEKIKEKVYNILSKKSVTDSLLLDAQEDDNFVE